MSPDQDSLPAIFTAVSLDGDHLDRPLLADEDQRADDSEKSTFTWNKVDALYPTFRIHGMIVGFLVQLVNVSGSTVMFYQWGDEGVMSKISTDLLDTFLHALVYAVTQADLYLYFIMWIVLTALLTQSGMQYVRQTYFEETTSSKRSIFVLGVQFYIGVVVGVFFAWTMIDCVLGLPVPILPMFGVLLFGLCISYTMIWCYDLEDSLGDED